jgi:cytochrome c-type biogenesis protein CcmH/NrfG
MKKKDLKNKRLTIAVVIMHLPYSAWGVYTLLRSIYNRQTADSRAIEDDETIGDKEDTDACGG